MPKQQAWVNVEDLSRNIDDSGPITNFTYFRIRRRMNKAGEFRMVVPATDPRIADTLAQERTVQAYAILNETPVWLGGGVITQQRWRKSGDGSPVLEVSGPDLLGELSRGTVGELELDSASGDTNLTAVLDEIPASWSSNVTGTTGDFSAKFDHIKPLAALNEIAEKLDAVFRLEADGATLRNLEWYNTLPSTSQVTLISYGELREFEDNPNVAIITDIQQVDDSSNIVNRAYFYGAGNADARLSSKQVDDSTHVWPDDSTTLDDGTNYSGSYSTSFDWDDSEKCIDEDNSIATYGVRSAAVSFPEIAPISNSDADFNAAMNTLIKATVRWLERRCEPSKTYTVTVAGLRKVVLPGDIVTVDARFYRDGEVPISVNNEDLTVIEIETLIDDNGVVIHTLTLGERRKYPETDGQIVASSVVSAQTTARLPQMYRNIDTVSFEENVDDSTTSYFYFFLGEEVTTVEQCVFRYTITPMTDTRSGLTGSGTANIIVNGATVAAHTSVTTDSQSTNATDTDGAHKHEITAPAGTIANNLGLDSGNNLVNADSSEHTFDTDTDGTHFHNFIHTHTTNSIAHASHTHTASDSGHTHALTWGITNEAGGNTYGETVLEFDVNGAGSYGYSGSQIGATDWYQFDITGAIRNSLTRRPGAAYNYIRARVSAGSQAGKTGRVRAQVQIRYAVQALSSY